MLEVELWQGFTRRGWLNDTERIKVTLRHNGPSTAEVVVPCDHPRAAVLLDVNARVTVWHTPPGGTRAKVLSGRVVRREAAGPSAGGSITATVEGDWRLLASTLAWPSPAAAVGSQGGYYTATGPAETVVKDIARANLTTRLARPVTIATDQARGATVTVSTRFAPLAEPVAQAADAGGVGVSVLQSGSGWTLDCYLPADRTTRTLSEAGGTVVDWKWAAADPTGTRVVVGGQGEGAARSLAVVVDTAAETAWADVLEQFVDARDLASGLAARGAEKLEEMLGTTDGITVVLAETDTVAYGRDLHLGDLVSVEVLPGVARTDRIREVTLTWTAGEGLIASPSIGDPSTQPDRRLFRDLRRIAAAVNTLRAR